MPRRIEDYRGLTQISRVRLLHAVQRTPGRRLQDLADAAGIHINTARDHLRVLEEEGLIVSAPEATGTRGRPPTVYTPVTNVGENPAARKRAEQAQALGDRLRKFAPDLSRPNELSGDALHQIDTLYTHLEDVGLEPELDEAALTIDLEPCPFASMIESERNVVCSVHATLVQHHLAQVPGPLKLGRLSPFVTPDVCQIALQHKKTTGLMPTRRTPDDPACAAPSTEAAGVKAAASGPSVPELPPVARAEFPPAQ